MRGLYALACFALLAFGAACNELDGRLEVGHLRWDGQSQPLGFIQFEPRLSWSASSPERGQRQTAYQILVASTPERLRPGSADIWDSGRVASGESLNVHYGGPTPKARQRGYWSVRVWGKDGRPSPFASPVWWEMGLYDEEWEGKWIGRPSRPDEAQKTHDRSVVYLRKAFVLGPNIERARLYASAFGAYEILINGKKAGRNVLAPGFTDYEKRVLFQSHDVTDLVRAGDNVIGAIVGGGWCTAALGGRSGACGFEPPRVMLQLEITLIDGTLVTVVTDETWTAHAGPIVTSHLYDGERYDARREMQEWSTPRFDARDWQPVQQYDRQKERDLVADPGPPVQAMAELEPIGVTEPNPGVFIFDFGQNVVGWAQIGLHAPAGTAVTLRFAEALAPDGSLYVANLRSARATDVYVARGEGTETWEPRFTLHGFRFVEVEGLPARAALSAITARAVHSEMAIAGTLETSDPRINRLFANIRWSQRGAFISVPTTGPQRDERLGTTLEAQVFALTGCLNYDVQLFYRKWTEDLRDARLQNAAFADAAPNVRDRVGGSGAGAAGIQVPWALHRCYADRTALDLHLPSMEQWIDWIKKENPDLVWSRNLGPAEDALELGPPTGASLIATAELVASADALAVMMRASGPNLEPSARKIEAVARDARSAFTKAFVLPDGRLTSDTQTAYALAIAKGALQGEARARAGERLAAAVERAGRHLTTGVRGTAVLLPALSLVGRDDLAYALLVQESCPSWLCSIGQGATTVWERWDGLGSGRGFADAASNSLNHYAFGAVGEWMYDAIGGIALDASAPAGRHFVVRPRPGGGITHARARYESLYGPISTDWSLEDGSFRLKVVIPAGSTATVTLPFQGKATESRIPVAQAQHVQVIAVGGGTTLLAVDSGLYDFAVDAP
ncbi:MAG TPA: family 78 glycoside hydrolase catalytic domain [Polyangiaceae bacterium]|nr:family 78 glycoside hydrolase catalytic domain [Polyangiaceae bacterium]